MAAEGEVDALGAEAEPEAEPEALGEEEEPAEGLASEAEGLAPEAEGAAPEEAAPDEAAPEEAGAANDHSWWVQQIPLNTIKQLTTTSSGLNGEERSVGYVGRETERKSIYLTTS